MTRVFVHGACFVQRARFVHGCVVARLNAQADLALKEPGLRHWLEEMSNVPVHGNAEHFAAQIASDRAL